jgi:DNA-binding SARP family transcriptional activator
MEIRLLGPVELHSARGPVPIGSAKQRALLAFLALHPQRLLTYDALIDGLWGDEPPKEPSRRFASMSRACAGSSARRTTRTG